MTGTMQGPIDLSTHLAQRKGTSNSGKLFDDYATKEELREALTWYRDQLGHHINCEALDSMTDLACVIYAHSRLSGFWNKEDGTPVNRNIGEAISLIHSELSEALEADRKNLKDQHLPEEDGFLVELCDVIIRTMDLAAGLYTADKLVSVLHQKIEYNLNRKDHKVDVRFGDDPERKRY